MSERAAANVWFLRGQEPVQKTPPGDRSSGAAVSPKGHLGLKAKPRIGTRPVARVEDGTEVIASWQRMGNRSLKLALRNVSTLVGYRFRCRVTDPHGFETTAQPEMSYALALISGERPATVFVLYPRDFHGAENLTAGSYTVAWELLDPMGRLLRQLPSVTFTVPLDLENALEANQVEP